MANEKYIGAWVLIPELSLYQLGEPPSSGHYTLNSVGSNISFSIEWHDVQGKSHTLSFEGPLDGLKYQSDVEGISHVQYEKIDDATLESTAYDGEQILMQARRVASDDGDLLAVSQVIHVDSEKFTNIQIYRRRE